MALLASLALVLALPTVSTPPPGAGPLTTLRDDNSRIEAILRRRPAPDSPQERAAKEELKGIVNNLLDYRELAQRSLAEQWDKLSNAQREEFVATLRELIEKNYVKQLRTNLDYAVNYKSERITAGQATVSTSVHVRTKGKSTDVTIDYKMKRDEGRWKVWDVIDDEVSMVQNYRSQFAKIISTDGYNALLARMRKKISEINEVQPNGGAAGGVMDSEHSPRQ